MALLRFRRRSKNDRSSGSLAGGEPSTNKPENVPKQKQYISVNPYPLFVAKIQLLGVCL
tara:strand:+ start:1310 stop:1486 length:177 start_codon:yes stop_codon:yes gene_type:complete